MTAVLGFKCLALYAMSLAERKSIQDQKNQCQTLSRKTINTGEPKVTTEFQSSFHVDVVLLQVPASGLDQTSE